MDKEAACQLRSCPSCGFLTILVQGIGQPMHPCLALGVLARQCGVKEIVRQEWQPDSHGVLIARGPAVSDGKGYVIWLGKNGSETYEGQITLAHEIAHALVSEAELYKTFKQYRAGRSRRNDKDEEEKICDAFAEALVKLLWQRWALYWNDNAKQT